MFSYYLGVEHPAYLFLLLLLPVLWWASYRSLAGLGGWRRFFTLLLRTALLTIFVLALAEVQLRKTIDRVTVIYLLDQSDSIPRAKRDAMLQYVVREVATHRSKARRDRAGVIVFGRDALIEIPPFDHQIASVGILESARELRLDATNLTAALKLAHASFKEDTAKRVVIVTDGNENIGDAQTVASTLIDDGVGIDIVPVMMGQRGEVIVEKMSLPADIRLGQAVEARVVLNNFGDQEVTGTLRVVQDFGRGEQLLSEQSVTLPPKRRSFFTLTHQIEKPSVYNYKATFVPDDPAADLMVENNQATTFTHVRGKGRVLVIEDSANPGEFEHLVEALNASDLEVTLQGTDNLFTTLGELQGYDAVILANVPRSGESLNGNDLVSFSDDQIDMLVRNTEQMGCGLIMLGGNNSFGAGGWINTELEKAMPVDFQIKSAKVRALGALVMIMHASELAQGNHWQKVVGTQAVKGLGPMDYCGLIHWGNTSGKDEWLWGAPQGLIQVGGRRKSMIAQINRMSPGDMPDFDPAMRMALAAFNRLQNTAAVKHMIIISDGDPSPPSPQVIAGLRSAGVQVSTVAIGTHGPAGSTPLQTLSTQTNGKYYVVTNPKALPKIYQREVRKIARPLIYEPEQPLTPYVDYPHEMLPGLGRGDTLPPIRGFVLTSVKESSLVEVAIRSPRPDDPKNTAVLASWQYGAGKAVAFTTDCGHRWADSWVDWNEYQRFFSQMVRWAMRPIDEDGNFTVTSEVKDGKAHVVVNALGEDDEFMNFVDISATGLGPDLQPFPVKIVQVAPGRYEGQFSVDAAGSYFLTVNPGTFKDPETGNFRARAPIISGVTVPYSAEYRDQQSNLTLMEALAGLKPAGGAPGKLIQGELERGNMSDLLKINTFRHDLQRAIAIDEVWPYFLLVGALVFFADIFIRRVNLGYETFAPAVRWVGQKFSRQEEDSARQENIDRLRSRKQALANQLDERRAAARFQPEAEAEAEQEIDLSSLSQPGQRPAAPQQPPLAADQEEDSYTARLLKAKQQAQRSKKRPDA